MDSPEVSLIIPTQGKRPSLAAALRSALAQDFASLEIVVVDDAVDGRDWLGGATIAPLLADPRVHVVPLHLGRGCAAAKNAGLRAARGNWVCYLDDDNEYRAGKISAQHAVATGSGSPLVLCGIEIRTAGGRRIVRQVSADVYSGDDLLLRTLPDTNALFHRRTPDVWWDESLGTVDDACFFHATVAQHDLIRVPNVPRALVIYHSHSGPRANREFVSLYRGQRCLVVRWSKRFSPAAQRVLLLRALVSFAKHRPGGWFALARHGALLCRVGGWREWRVVANCVGVKTPGVRRWMVT